MRWRYMFSSKAASMGKFCNRHGSLAVREQKPPYLLLARGCSSGGMQHKHSPVIKAQDPDWPEDDNSWENTEGGKYIFLHGKRYDWGDPEFIRLRNENFLKHADELADMFDFSHGGSLVEALRQLRNIQTEKKQGREDVIGGSLLGPLDDAVGSVKKTMQSGGTEDDTDNEVVHTHGYLHERKLQSQGLVLFPGLSRAMLPPCSHLYATGGMQHRSMQSDGTHDDMDIVFDTDNDFYRLYDFKTREDLKAKLGLLDGGSSSDVEMDSKGNYLVSSSVGF